MHFFYYSCDRINSGHKKERVNLCIVCMTNYLVVTAALPKQIKVKSQQNLYHYILNPQRKAHNSKHNVHNLPHSVINSQYNILNPHHNLLNSIHVKLFAF